MQRTQTPSLCQCSSVCNLGYATFKIYLHNNIEHTAYFTENTF